MRAEFHPHDHAWLAQFGASLPTSRAALLRARLLDAARFLGAVVLVALAAVGAGALLGNSAPQLAVWAHTILMVIVHAAWLAVSWW